MSYFLIAGALLGAFSLQFVFSMYQMKGFNKHYKALRRLGRVAIGKNKGGFYAGAIVMFAIDDHGVIIAGSCMEGFTFLARFKEFSHFNGENVGYLTKEHCKGIGKPLEKATMNATSNYNTIMSGEEVKEVPGLLTRIANFVFGQGKTKKVCN